MRNSTGSQLFSGFFRGWLVSRRPLVIANEDFGCDVGLSPSVSVVHSSGGWDVAPCFWSYFSTVRPCSHSLSGTRLSPFVTKDQFTTTVSFSLECCWVVLTSSLPWIYLEDSPKRRLSLKWHFKVSFQKTESVKTKTRKFYSLIFFQLETAHSSSGWLMLYLKSSRTCMING